MNGEWLMDWVELGERLKKASPATYDEMLIKIRKLVVIRERIARLDESIDPVLAFLGHRKFSS